MIAMNSMVLTAAPTVWSRANLVTIFATWSSPCSEYDSEARFSVVLSFLPLLGTVRRGKLSSRNRCQR